jgi:hypothetical protein
METVRTSETSVNFSVTIRRSLDRNVRCQSRCDWWDEYLVHEFYSCRSCIISEIMSIKYERELYERSALICVGSVHLCDTALGFAGRSALPPPPPPPPITTNTVAGSGLDVNADGVDERPLRNMALALLIRTPATDFKNSTTTTVHAERHKFVFWRKLSVFVSFSTFSYVILFHFCFLILLPPQGSRAFEAHVRSYIAFPAIIRSSCISFSVCKPSV